MSDLEQRTVALNLLLTQSLRGSLIAGDATKSDACAAAAAAAAATATAGAAASASSACFADADAEADADEELRLFGESATRPLVSKDANWFLSGGVGGAATAAAAQLSPTAASPLSGKNPVERAEKLLAVLKHRLFSAQVRHVKIHEHRELVFGRIRTDRFMSI